MFWEGIFGHRRRTADEDRTVKFTPSNNRMLRAPQNYADFRFGSNGAPPWISSAQNEGIARIQRPGPLWPCAVK